MENRKAKEGNGGNEERGGGGGREGGGGGKGDGRHALPPDVRDAVNGLCMRARQGPPVTGRFETARGVDEIAVVAVGEHGAAWFLARAHARDSDEGMAWPILEVSLLAIAAVAPESGSWISTP